MFNETMVKKVGVDRFIPKFSANELVKEVLPVIQRTGNKSSRSLSVLTPSVDNYIPPI